MADGYQFVVDFGTYTFGTNNTVNAKSKIKCRTTDRQHFYIPFWCIHINLFRQKTHLKVLQKIYAIGILIREHFSYLSKPFIKPVFISSSFFVFIVSSQPFLSYFIHSLASYLHFYPFALRPHHSSVQCFVSVAFRITKPISQSLRRWRIFVSNN